MFTLLTKIFMFLFGKPQKHISTDLEIKFHKDANFFGEHGTINVSHVRLGLVETPVRFVFAGVTTPPRLDLTTYIRIWEEARAQGFVPHHLVTYGRNNEVIDVSKPAEDNTTGVLKPQTIGIVQKPVDSVELEKSIQIREQILSEAFDEAFISNINKPITVTAKVGANTVEATLSEESSYVNAVQHLKPVPPEGRQLAEVNGG